MSLFPKNQNSQKYFKDILQSSWFKFLLGIVFLASVYNFIQQGLIPAFQVEGVDFKGYYEYARIIDPKHADQSEPWYLYFPVWAIIMKPFLLFSLPVAKNIWIIINIILMVLFIYGSYSWCKSNSRSFYPFFYFVLLSFLVLNFSPVHITFRNGQINMVVLICIAFTFYEYSKGKYILPALLLSLVITIRYIPFLLIIYWLLKRDYKMVGYTIGFLILLVLISVGILGLQVHKDYWILTQHYADYVKENYNYFGNISLYSLLRNLQIYQFLNPGYPALLIQLLFAFSLCFVSVFLSRKYNQKYIGKSNLLDYSLWIAMMPLLSYFCENHHFTVLLISLVIFLAYFDRIRKFEYGLMMMLGWGLIYLGFHLHDLSVKLHQGLFMINYIDLAGNILIYIILSFSVLSIIRKGEIIQV